MNLGHVVWALAGDDHLEVENEEEEMPEMCTALLVPRVVEAGSRP